MIPIRSFPMRDDTQRYLIQRASQNFMICSCIIYEDNDMQRDQFFIRGAPHKRTAFLREQLLWPSGSSDGAAAGLPGFLRPAAWRCSSFSASIRRSSCAASLASASSDAIACWILASRFCLSPAQSGISSPRLSLPKVTSSSASAASARRQHASHLGFQFQLALLHALITHRLVFRRIRLDLLAIQRDMAEFDQSCRLTQLQNLHEQRHERLQMPLAEVADRREMRRIERHDHHKIIPVRGRPWPAVFASFGPSTACRVPSRHSVPPASKGPSRRTRPSCSNHIQFPESPSVGDPAMPERRAIHRAARFRRQG